jgi:predicted HicB family RNase H-like nuclease
MRNVLEIDGHRAVVAFDPEIELFRGEFLGLAGGADFYADTVKDLREEGRRSLAAYLEECRKRGVEPRRSYSGRFNVRLPPRVHEAAVVAATASDQSLNEWVANVIAVAAAVGEADDEAA